MAENQTKHVHIRAHRHTRQNLKRVAAAMDVPMAKALDLLVNEAADDLNVKLTPPPAEEQK